MESAQFACLGMPIISPCQATSHAWLGLPLATAQHDLRAAFRVPACSERTHALRDTATAVLKEEIAELRCAPLNK